MKSPFIFLLMCLLSASLYANNGDHMNRLIIKNLTLEKDAEKSFLDQLNQQSFNPTKQIETRFVKSINTNVNTQITHAKNVNDTTARVNMVRLTETSHQKLAKMWIDAFESLDASYNIRLVYLSHDTPSGLDTVEKIEGFGSLLKVTYLSSSRVRRAAIIRSSDVIEIREVDK